MYIYLSIYTYIYIYIYIYIYRRRLCVPRHGVWLHPLKVVRCNTYTFTVSCLIAIIDSYYT